MPKTLKLTVHQQAFEVMVTGEKKEEYRNRSKWISSRLYEEGSSKCGKYAKLTPKEYDFVEITNGYGKDKPAFTAVFKGFEANLEPMQKTYSNGLTVDVENMDYIIKLGEITSIKNYTV